MKKICIFFVLILFTVAFAGANGSHVSNFEEGKMLTDSEIACDKLSDEQLEAIGEYYMELMHPGEAHELMDEMMGGEGSASLKQVHINMAQQFYCEKDINGMMSVMKGGMMGSGGMMNMMNMMGGEMMAGMMGSGMMGYGFGWGAWSFLYWLFAIGLVALVWVLVIKFLKDLMKKGK